MSTLGAALRAAYSVDLLAIPVPEWSEILPDGMVYARAFTERDLAELGNFEADDDPEGFAEVVLRHALDRDGGRLFDRGDKIVLVTAVEAHVLRRIASAIMTGDPSGALAASEDAREHDRRDGEGESRGGPGSVAEDQQDSDAGAQQADADPDDRGDCARPAIASV